MTNTSDPTMIV